MITDHIFHCPGNKLIFKAKSKADFKHPQTFQMQFHVNCNILIYTSGFLLIGEFPQTNIFHVYYCSEVSPGGPDRGGPCHFLTTSSNVTGNMHHPTFKILLGKDLEMNGPQRTACLTKGYTNN